MRSMASYQVEWNDPNNGWRFIRSLSGETGTDAFQRFNDQEGLEPGEYRFRTDEGVWEYVTLTEDGAEIYTE